MLFALIGNQNSGKTTLFNLLTGSNQRVGNFPGVTVEHKIGIIKGTPNYSLVDLPGTYSLSPYSKDEIITRDFLLNKKIDGVINIVDATNIERSLYLTLQLLELNLPVIIALNMIDELKSNKGNIDILTLSKELNTPVFPISAYKNLGIKALLNSIILNQKVNYSLSDAPHYTPSINRCICTVSDVLKTPIKNLNISKKFYAIKIIEDDYFFKKLLKISPLETKLIENAIKKMELETNFDKNTAIANMRYSFIEKICAKTVIKPTESKQYKRSIKIDKILTNKYLSLPIFFIILFLIFHITFNLIGNKLSDSLTYIINYFISSLDSILALLNVNPLVHSLIIDGIFSGIGSVLSFLPIIIVLFFFLSLLEDTGYMARVVFIADKLLRKMGISGKSFVPILLGFGCSVPAVLSTRTIPSNKSRLLTIILIPFMSCSAKIPIYAVFCAAFFKNNSALVMSGLYIIGIVIGIISSLLLKDTLFYDESEVFIMELPNYRFPSLKNMLLLIWNKSKDFIEKAFSLILMATVTIWLFQNFDLKLNLIEDPSNSILAKISKKLIPVFLPLGFGDWRVITALISGLTAKEAVISTLSILLDIGTLELKYALNSLFTPLSAFSFLIFTLLYTPCIAAIATIKKELNSVLKTFTLIIFQFAVAWISSFIFFTIGKLLL